MNDVDVHPEATDAQQISDRKFPPFLSRVPFGLVIVDVEIMEHPTDESNALDARIVFETPIASVAEKGIAVSQVVLTHRQDIVFTIVPGRVAFPKISGYRHFDLEVREGILRIIHPPLERLRHQPGLIQAEGFDLVQPPVQSLEMLDLNSSQWQVFTEPVDQSLAKDFHEMVMAGGGPCTTHDPKVGPLSRRIMSQYFVAD